MKGINIFLVLLISVFFIYSVSADTTNGSIEAYVISDTSHTENVHASGDGYTGDFVLHLNHDTGGIPDTYEIEKVQLLNSTEYGSITTNIGDPFNIYWSNNGVDKDELVGYGVFYVHKIDYAGSNLVNASILIYFDEFNKKEGESGAQYYILDGVWSSIYSSYSNFYHDDYSSFKTPYYNANGAVVSCYSPHINQVLSINSGSLSTDHEYSSFGSFRNDYEIEYTNSYVDIDIQRQGFDTTYDLNSSHIKMVNTTDSTTYYESSDTTSNTSHFLVGGDYNYYIVRQIDDYEHLIFTFEVPVVESEGTIELNQTSYTEPELIKFDAELTSYDFTNHIYRMLMEYSTDYGSNWERLSVSYNTTSVMDDAIESRTATIDSSYYTLPIKIRVVIDDYDKLTSSSSTIAISSEVYYNPPAAYDYIVSGTVFDADNGAVIEGALVSASGVTTTSSTSTVTGKFQLYLSEGYYTITTSKSGYQNNVQTDLLIDHDVTWAQIHLTPIGYGNGTLYGNVNDVDTGYAIQDVHVIITNTTDSISAYTSSGGYYEATGLAQSSTYNIRALRSGYYTYNGSVTTEASGATHKSFEMVQINYSVTPTPTTVSTYPGGEGHEWSNDEIMTMLRVIVPGFFMLMLIFLFLAVIMGVTGNNGNGGQRGLGLNEIWKR